MKRFFCCVLCLMMGVSAMASELPTWKCKDLQRIESAKREFLAEGNLWRAMEMDVIRSFAQKEPKTFAELETAVESVGKPDGWTDSLFASWTVNAKKQSAYFIGMYSDGWKFCKANPTYFDAYYVLYLYNYLGISKDEQYSRLISSVFEYSHSDSDLRRIVSRIIELADSQDPVQVKADLQKLNRKLSKNLLKDRTAWEPVIAMIRTTLETY